MKQRIVHKLNMLKGVKRFILENAITPSIPRVTELAAEINTGISALETAAGLQVGGSSELSGGVETRRGRAKALRDYLKDIARVGRALDGVAFPGVAETFILPRSNGYNSLLASANAMVAKATELQTEFVARGLPATFPAEVGALITAFESGTDLKIDGKQVQVEATSALHHNAAAAMDAATELDAIMRAHFRNDPVKLDGWVSARHVQRPDQPQPVEETPPSGGEETGTSTTTTIG